MQKKTKVCPSKQNFAAPKSTKISETAISKNLDYQAKPCRFSKLDAPFSR
jgi:hypothetical protein